MRSWAEYKKTMGPGDTLWSAARAGDVAQLARLLEIGAELDAKDSRGYSALMLAAYAGQEEAVGYLLARGADPNTADAGGSTVLMGAAFKGNLAIVERLLQAGAAPERRNAKGLTAIDFARTFGRNHVEAFLATRLEAPRFRGRAAAVIYFLTRLAFGKGVKAPAEKLAG